MTGLQRIIDPADIGDSNENILRPLYLKDFCGQERIKQNLKVFIDSTIKRGDILDHVLLYGPPGLGKTTLSKIISNELGSGFKIISGPAISKSGDLAAILTNLQFGDVLFIDEIHRMHISVEEILYSAMEDYKIDIIIGEGPSARNIKIDIPKFTLIGATTRLGLLSNPLRDRFGIVIRMDFYNPEELKDIVIRDAKILGIDIENDGALEIANRSRGTPRIAIRLLKRVRDFVMGKINQKNCSESLKKLEIDSEGLDSSDHKYLNFIIEKCNGGPAGIETIVAGLNEERGSVEDTIEPYLIQNGFIIKTSRGRVVTDKTFLHFGLSPKNSEINNDLFAEKIE